MVKAEHQKPAGELRPLEIPEWKWDCVTMDFVTGLPRFQEGHDVIWVIVDRLTKMAHFIAIRTDYKVPRLYKLYICRIVIVDRLTKMAHFIAIRTDYKVPKFYKLYIDRIIKLYRIPVSIVSDRDARFISKFGKGLQQALGMELHLSASFHPQTY